MNFCDVGFCCFLLIIKACYLTSGTIHANRLFYHLMKRPGYSSTVRPVIRHSDPVLVHMNLSLVQILDVAEKSQIITLNMWVFQEWFDQNFRWNPFDFGNVTEMHIPSKDIWTPDLVLYNNAGGDWDLASSSNTKVTVSHDGRVRWKPPIIFKSQCEMNVEFFPFDTQSCPLKIGTWTHDGLLIDLRHTAQKTNTSQPSFDYYCAKIDYAIDLSDYKENVEWDLLSMTAEREIELYPCCPEPYVDLRFHISLRRKTLFYGINLICPCLAISFLTVLVFYLPAESGEKMSLSISILLSLTVFFLLIFDISPPTSLVVPLILKYLLFTMILITLSVMATVVVINIHRRSPDTHDMSPWVRRVFMRTLPTLLLMKRPETESRVKDLSYIYPYDASDSSTTKNKLRVRASRAENDHYDESTSPHQDWVMRHRSTVLSNPQQSYHSVPGDNVVSEIESALRGVKRIVNHIRVEDENASKMDDWKYVAVVLDRLFLWLFTIAAIVGVLGIFMQAPTLTDVAQPMTAELSLRRNYAQHINVTTSDCMNSNGK